MILFRRPWRFSRPLAAAALVLPLAACAVPDRYERRGHFEIEYYRTDAFGHTSTRRALYHLNGGSRSRVTDSAVSFQIALRDADRIIYDTCDVRSATTEARSGCVHMYFDGHTGKSHTLGRGLKISMSALEQSERWSWNGRFVALGDEYEVVLVDLETGSAIRLAQALRLEQPYYPQKWQHRSVQWGAGGPDGVHAALMVHSPHGPGLPVAEWDEELYSVDGASGALTLIADHTGQAGVHGEGGLWRASDFRWDEGTLQPPRF